MKRCGVVEKLTWCRLWSQDSQRVVLRLERAEKEADRLRVMLEERESSHNQITAEMEQQLREWAQELGAECQNLHFLVEQGGAKLSSVQIPPRYYFEFSA